jgi:hypothetical protein
MYEIIIIYLNTEKIDFSQTYLLVGNHKKTVRSSKISYCKKKTMSNE